jgi:hypothetical protein
MVPILHCLIVSLIKPTAAELSVITAFGRYLYPISSSAVDISTAAFQLVNRAPSLGLPAEAMTALILLHSVYTALLFFLMGYSVVLLIHRWNY